MHILTVEVFDRSFIPKDWTVIFVLENWLCTYLKKCIWYFHKTNTLNFYLYFSFLGLISHTALLAEKVSAKVKVLDLAKSRVAECQQRVHDLIDLR